MHRRVANNGLQRHVNFYLLFFILGQLGAEISAPVSFGGRCVGRAPKYVNVVCLIILVEINYT
eukprot:CCRYP_014004-RA/>CCRYP_014004-RA protein AED:0.14 eAED:0.14 QI:122/1/0.66/1/0/0/3/0/62